MVSARPDLNGSRLYVPGLPEVWLVFHGMKHHVASPRVYEALFGEAENLVSVKDLDDVLRGPDLNEGSCLVRSGDQGAIYLVTGFPACDVRRHHVRSWEDFLAFGFVERLVVNVPELVVEAIPAGRPLQAAATLATKSRASGV